jgi:hypothetical protein
MEVDSRIGNPTRPFTMIKQVIVFVYANDHKAIITNRREGDVKD